MLCTHKQRTVFASLTLVCLLLIAAGCSSSQVRLRYLPESEMSSVTMSHSSSIDLVQFTDARKNQALGIVDGKELMPVSNVAAWITHGLEDQLMRHGVTVSYILSKDQRTSDTIITGTVQDLTITRVSAGKYKGELTLLIAVNGNPATTYKASLVQQDIPYTNIVEPLLAELLDDALAAAVPEILAAL